MTDEPIMDIPRDNTVPDMDEIDWGPRREPLDNGDPCPECGHSFDADEWDVRHLRGGASAGESWIYKCPGCEQETCSIGT